MKGWARAYAKAWEAPVKREGAHIVGLAVYGLGWLLIPLHNWWEWLMFAAYWPVVWPLRNLLLRWLLRRHEAIE